MGHCCVNLVDMATDEAGIGLLIDYGNDHENEGKSEQHEIGKEELIYDEP